MANLTCSVIASRYIARMHRGELRALRYVNGGVYNPYNPSLNLEIGGTPHFHRSIASLTTFSVEGHSLQPAMCVLHPPHKSATACARRKI